LTQVGSKFFNTQLVQGLRTAAARHGMQLPPLVQYSAPDLWDFKMRPKAAAVWRSKVRRQRTLGAGDVPATGARNL
jgi:hypothetical protein